MKIISRAEAKALGLKRYFTGKPCKNGHVAEKRFPTGECMECRRIYNKKYLLEHPELVRYYEAKRAKKRSADFKYKLTRNEIARRKWAADPEKFRTYYLKKYHEYKLDPVFKKKRRMRNQLYRIEHPPTLEDKKKKADYDLAYRKRLKARAYMDPSFREKIAEMDRAKSQRYRLNGPINPKGEMQWLRKAQAQLRKVKRALRRPEVLESLRQE